jgi:chorismate dehydratase
LSFRLGRIAYLNADPVYRAWDTDRRPPGVTCKAAPPAILNRLLAGGRLDAAPVSSVAYARHFPAWQLLPDLSISSRGPVMSVLLVSRVPLARLEGRRVLVTSDSETSAALLALCLRREGVRPQLERRALAAADPLPPEAAAALVIGDTALAWGRRREGLKVVDLGAYWHAWTGRPLVYAVWAVRREVAAARPRAVAALVDWLWASRAQGGKDLPAIAAAASRGLGLPPARLLAYLQGLHYGLGTPEQAGLTDFFRRLAQADLLAHAPALDILPCPATPPASVRPAAGTAGLARPLEGPTPCA